VRWGGVEVLWSSCAVWDLRWWRWRMNASVAMIARAAMLPITMPAMVPVLVFFGGGGSVGFVDRDLRGVAKTVASRGSVQFSAGVFSVAFPSIVPPVNGSTLRGTW